MIVRKLNLNAPQHEKTIDIHLSSVLLFLLCLIAPFAIFYGVSELKEFELRLAQMVFEQKAEYVQLLTQENTKTLAKIRKRESINIFLMIFYVCLGYFASVGLKAISGNAPSVQEMTVWDYMYDWGNSFYNVFVHMPFTQATFCYVICIGFCIIILSLYGVWLAIGSRARLLYYLSDAIHGNALHCVMKVEFPSRLKKLFSSEMETVCIH